ncbi:MAG: helix-turn-helix transcriptional regulator [Lachnospiraceae bacterium]
MNFSNTLKNLRETRNMTQVQLADLLQVSRPTIAGYETKNRQPDFEKLLQLSDFFEVSVDYLITGEGFHGSHLSSEREHTEQIVDQRLMQYYHSLSLESKQDALKYMELLTLRDEKSAKK